MKKALTTSVLLNLALALCLFAVLQQRKAGIVPPASDTSGTEVSARPEPASSESTGTEAAAFQGEQVALSQNAQPEELQSRPQPAQLKERPIVLPLVFREIDVSQLKLNSDQLQAIEDLRQKFLDEIGGLQQDPSDPIYRERWEKSQPELDNDLRGMIGITAFQNYQIEAATEQSLP